MAEQCAWPHLSDYTLQHVMCDLKIARNNLSFALVRETNAAKRGKLASELCDLTRSYLSAVAENTARLALSPEKRAELASAPYPPNPVEG